MKSPISWILTRFSKAFHKTVDAVAGYILDHLDEDSELRELVGEAWITYKISSEVSRAIRDAMQDAYKEGSGGAILLLPSQLEKAWDDSGMVLSEKLHGIDEEMRAQIVRTIKVQLQKNQHAMKMAQELYDGYSSGKAIVRTQELPKYLNSIIAFARRSTLSDDERKVFLQELRKAQS